MLSPLLIKLSVKNVRNEQTFFFQFHQIFSIFFQNSQFICSPHYLSFQLTLLNNMSKITLHIGSSLLISPLALMSMCHIVHGAGKLCKKVISQLISYHLYHQQQQVSMRHVQVLFQRISRRIHQWVGWIHR